MFHDADRAAYVDGLCGALAPDGLYAMLCFSDRVPGDIGPRRTSEAEIRSTFAHGWTVESVEPTEMLLTDQSVPAYRALIRKA